MVFSTEARSGFAPLRAENADAIYRIAVTHNGIERTPGSEQMLRARSVCKRRLLLTMLTAARRCYSDGSEG